MEQPGLGTLSKVISSCVYYFLVYLLVVYQYIEFEILLISLYNDSLIFTWSYYSLISVLQDKRRACLSLKPQVNAFRYIFYNTVFLLHEISCLDFLHFVYLLQFEDLLFLCVHYFKVTVNDEFLQSKWAILLSPKVVVFFFKKLFTILFRDVFRTLWNM